MQQREQSLPRGGLMCDDMGLGKTSTTLGLMLNSTLPASMSRHNLVICPKAVISQWAAAANGAGFNVVQPLTSSEWSKPSPFDSTKPWIYLINPHALLHRPLLFQRTWGRICIDEAHEVSKSSGAFYKAIKKLRRSITWCITATPSKNDKAMNSLKEIRALFSLVGFDPVKLVDSSYICQVIQDAMIHRSMDEMRSIIKELPQPPIIKREVISFESPEEEEFYRGIQGQLVARWRALERDNVTARFQLIMHLRQISIHPQTYIASKKRQSPSYNREDWTGTSSKFQRLLTTIEGQATPARWIVFCHFHDEMDMLEDYLYNSPMIGRINQYHGGIDITVKDRIIESTKQTITAHEVLLVQLQSGGVGLNLQHFTRVVFMSPWWTRALMNQAIARAVRMGQKEVVEVYHFLLSVEDTLNIDELMMGHADVKGRVLDEILSKASRGEILDRNIDGVA